MVGGVAFKFIDLVLFAFDVVRVAAIIVLYSCPLSFRDIASPAAQNMSVKERLSDTQLGNIVNLLDVHSPGQATMYEGGKITLYHHMVIFCNNEAVRHLLRCFQHKQIWLLRQSSWHQQSVTWHFPGEAPTVQPYIGVCGNVANYSDPSEEQPPVADWLQEWMLQSLPVHLPGVAGPLSPEEETVARRAFLAGLLHAGQQLVI